MTLSGSCMTATNPPSSACSTSAATSTRRPTPRRSTRWPRRRSSPAYIGFDATAPSLHVGSLVQIMMLRRLQQAGHKPIVLMGGGTTKVGDPSGKDESRKLLTDEEIEANIASIRKVFERFLTFGDGPTDAIMVDNAEWLDELEYVPFLREVGPHFTINRMLTFDSVKLRLDREQPLTFLEFNYMILQAYDFLELSRRAGCRLQMGGSDQWGNIVNGIELARRIDGTEVFGADDAADHHRRRRQDGQDRAGRGVAQRRPAQPLRLLAVLAEHGGRRRRAVPALFTDLPLDEIARLEALEGAEINEAKMVLATEATAMLHGDEAARGRGGDRASRPSRKAAPARICRRSRSATADRRSSHALTGLRLRRVERRGQAQDRRGRGAAGRRGGQRSAPS